MHFNRIPLSIVIIHYLLCEGNNEANDHYKKLLDPTTSIPRHNDTITEDRELQLTCRNK